MAENPNNLIQECPTCGALIDVAGEEPFALMHCPTCGGAMRVRRQFDHFELQEQLGSGGMGTVYRALDQNLGRQVALKLLQKEQSANPEFIAQFAKEAAITASINHPHVVKVFSTGQDHGLVYIAMELVDKGSLDDLLALEERVPEVQVLTTGIQIAQGLNAALGRGLIHRDVKPGNILFANAHTAKIVDFGLAVLMEHAGAVMGEVWGTPAYVAPEKLDDQPEDLRSDIYSLGATLFHALAGVPPCDMETNQMSALLAVKRREPSLRAVVPEVSAATAFAIDKTLKFDPADRFQTYEELVEALEFARDELVASAQETEDAARAAEAARHAPQKDMNWLTYVVVVLVVALGIGGNYWREHRHGPVAETAEEATGGSGLDKKYQAARALLASGEAAQAADAFRALEALPDVPQPRLNWITLHAGLAEFLAGRVEEGRADFAKIEGRGVFSTDPTEQRLADFFVGLAKLAATDAAVPPPAVQALEPVGEQSVALLAGAAKDWALGDFAGAAALARQFGDTALPLKTGSVAEFKPLAAPFVADYAAYAPAADAAKSARTLDQRETALAAVEAAKGKLKLPGALPARLDAAAADLREKIAAEKTARSGQMAALEAADEKALAEMKAKLSTLCGQFRYAEAYAAVKATTVQSDSGREAHAIMVKKTEWLARFKATLIADVTAIGYAPALVKRNGLQIAGGVTHRANDLQVEIVSSFGSIPVPWTDLSTDCILAMGRSFLHAAHPPDKLADRAWFLGVFAFFNGKDAQGRDLLVQASQAKDEYRDQLALFIPTAEAP